MPSYDFRRTEAWQQNDKLRETLRNTTVLEEKNGVLMSVESGIVLPSGVQNLGIIIPNVNVGNTYNNRRAIFFCPTTKCYVMKNELEEQWMSSHTNYPSDYNTFVAQRCRLSKKGKHTLFGCICIGRKSISIVVKELRLTQLAA